MRSCAGSVTREEDIGRCARARVAPPRSNSAGREASFYLPQAEHPGGVLPSNSGGDGLWQIREPAAIRVDDVLIAGPALGRPCIGPDNEAVGKAQKEVPPRDGNSGASRNVAAIRQLGDEIR